MTTEFYLKGIYSVPKIFEKYGGPDVLAMLEGVDEQTVKSFEQAIKKRDEEGA